jgi:hypothetical protein
MPYALMNFVNSTLFQKTCGPIIENEHLWVSTKFMCLHIPISLLLAYIRAIQSRKSNNIVHLKLGPLSVLLVLNNKAF